MKKTNKTANMTSFHGTTITTTVNKLIKALGEPDYDDNSGDDKVNFEWVCENNNGEVVTIYDWKKYRRLDGNEKVVFNLGGHNLMSTLNGKDELLELLNK